MITVFTPTYNRAYILKNAFESLKKQTDNNFEWIIVDDGSTDNTESLVQSWKEEKLLFDIRYIKQENGGKHRAINRGVSMAKGDYIIILDSDDFLTDNAIEKINGWVKTINGLKDFAGVAGLRGWINKSGNIGGSGCLKDPGYIDAKNTERRKYHLEGDKAEVYKAEVLRKFPFPEFEGENFLPENVVWDTIANAGYKIRWFNEIIYKCEYLEDGLTKKAKCYDLLINNFQGYTLSTKIYISEQTFLWKYLTIGIYIYVAKTKGLNLKEVKRILSINKIQILIGKCMFKLNEIRKNIKLCKK